MCPLNLPVAKSPSTPKFNLFTIGVIPDTSVATVPLLNAEANSLTL